MKLLITISICFTCLFSYGQAPGILWQKCFGSIEDDEATSIVETTDGGSVIAGYSNNEYASQEHGLYDAWIVKLNAQGDTLWEKFLGGSWVDYATSIKQTTDGGYILAGYTGSNDGDVSGNHGGTFDAWVVKLDSLGNIQWQKCLGGSGWDQAYDITQTIDSGYIVACVSDSRDGDVTGVHSYYVFNDCWIVRLDNNGNIIWEECFGGTEEDGAYYIQQTFDKGFIVAGSTGSTDGDINGLHGLSDVLLLKLDSSGNLQWQKCFGSSEWEYGNSVKQTSDSGFIVAATTYPYFNAANSRK